MGWAGGFSEDLTDGGGGCLQGCDSLISLGQGGMLRRHAWPRA